jgi:hypothetical protein
MRWLGMGVPMQFASGPTAMTVQQVVHTLRDSIDKKLLKLTALVFAIKNFVKVSVHKLLHHEGI